ncbi:MAG: hypothetical protein AAF497_18225 [Planctomycetota bacterium]
MSKSLPRIRCTGREGEKEFVYSYQLDDLRHVWHFTVESDPRPPSNGTFDMAFKEMPDGTLRQTVINANDEACYLGMGIPEAMLPEVKRILGKAVESSPPDEDDAWRSCDGERMWQRLREKGIAEYDED